MKTTSIWRYAVSLSLFFAWLIPVGCDKTGQSQPSAATRQSILDKVKQEGTLRVGYGGYPPYLSRDPNTGNVSGFSVDLLNAIVKEWGRDIKIEWVETNWDRMKADMGAGKFDLMVEPIFRTIPRAAEVGFTRPYSYFGYAVGVVRSDENRFKTIDDVNNPDVVVAVTQGVTDHEYAKTRLAKVPPDHLKVIPSGNIETTLTEVLLGKADIALADVPTVQKFVSAHRDKVKAVFMENPPAIVAAGFMTRSGDFKWISFLDVSIEYLDNMGEIERLCAKHGVPYYRVERKQVGG